jgi:hypothetical protein
LPWEKIPRRAPGPGFPTGSPGIPPNELPAATIEFKYDGLSRLVERKVTRGIDPPEVEGYQWDGWKLIMIAKLNTDGTYHSRKWSCVWRPDIGNHGSTAQPRIQTQQDSGFRPGSPNALPLSSALFTRP